MSPIKNLSGQRFGRLAVISRAEDKFSPSGKKYIVWHCKCDCGNDIDVISRALCNGHTKSCGCYHNEMAIKNLPSNKKHEVIPGEKIGRWTVIAEGKKRKQPNGSKVTMALCMCECGIIREVSLYKLKAGKSNSCGCYSREIIKARSTTHGLSKTRLHTIWRDMRVRCSNHNATGYDNYGGRGIKVCTEWQDFPPFYEWAMANGYNDTLTLDRIEVDGNYEPSNCRWVDMKTQQNNRSNNRRIEFNGIKKTVAEWTDEIGGIRDVMYAHTDEEIIEILKRELNNTENRTS